MRGYGTVLLIYCIKERTHALGAYVRVHWCGRNSAVPVPVRGVREVAETWAPSCCLFDKFFNNVIFKKFEIALLCLICRFGVIENQMTLYVG